MLCWLAFSSLVSTPSIFEAWSSWSEFFRIDSSPNLPPGSENGDSSARDVAWAFNLLDDLDEAPMEDSLGFFLRVLLGMSGIGGDEIPRAGSTIWRHLLEVPSVHSLAGDWQPFKDLLDCLDFSDFNLVGDSNDEVATAEEEDCRLDDFGGSSRSLAREPDGCSKPPLWDKSENDDCIL